MTDSSLMRLHQRVVEYFSDDELRTLCFDLELDYDELRGGGITRYAGHLPPDRPWLRPALLPADPKGLRDPWGLK